MKIGIDLDGVIANNIPEIVFRLKKLGIESDPTKWPSYYIEDHVDGLPKNWAREQFSDPLFYKNCMATEDSFYSINEWFYSGNDIYIITSRQNHLEEVTLNWLDEWSIPYNEVFMGVPRLEKYKILENLEADMMIEDHPHEAMIVRERGFTSYLISTPYNRGFKYGESKPTIVSDMYAITVRLVGNPNFKSRRRDDSPLYR